MPTVICVHDLMAIGTSRGFILVYDVQQNLKMMLGSTSAGAQCVPTPAAARAPPRPHSCCLSRKHPRFPRPRRPAHPPPYLLRRPSYSTPLCRPSYSRPPFCLLGGLARYGAVTSIEVNFDNTRLMVGGMCQCAAPCSGPLRYRAPAALRRPPPPSTRLLSWAFAAPRRSPAVVSFCWAVLPGLPPAPAARAGPLRAAPAR